MTLLDRDLGRIAYETWARERERVLKVDGVRLWKCKPWIELSEGGRDAWEAAAVAVVREAKPKSYAR